MKIGTFIAGLVLIVAGVVIFMANLGYGSWSLTGQLYKFWPVILILIGISFLWGGVIPRWLGVLVIIVVSGGIVILALLNPVQHFELFPGQRETSLLVERSQYSEVTSGEVDLKFGGGKISLDSETAQWFEGRFRGAAGARPSVNSDNNRVKINIRQAEAVWYPRRQVINDWQVHLSPDLSWVISLDAGAAEGDLNFTGVDFERLNVKLGAGDFRFAFGNNGQSGKVKMQAGASNVKISIPPETGVRVRIKGALASTNLEELGWPVADRYYVSPGYETASSRLDFELEIAVGNLELEVLSPQQIQL